MSYIAKNNKSDPRLAELLRWIATLDSFEIDSSTIRVASADASFRRYFRIDSSIGSLIVMDAPPDKEKITPFIHVDEVFEQCGVSVPSILAKNIEQGFLLLSDLGTVTYQDQLNETTAHGLYMDAIDALIRIQCISQDDVLPEYDRATLLRELNLFPQWYVDKHLHYSLSSEQTQVIEKTFDLILANNLAQPQVYVHRDYHCRNLMYLSGDSAPNPGILDFQDALYGPITYDLVSLLRDAYIEWDEEHVLDWVIRYWEKARKAALPVNPDIDAFYRDFEWMGLQRHLKVLGIFSRLSHRDGKNGYLNDIPLVQKYVSKTTHRYRELAPLAKLFDQLQDIKQETSYSF